MDIPRMHIELFNKSIDSINRLFNISEFELLKRNTSHSVTDYKKMVTMKFYNLKTHKRDNSLMFLTEQFNCCHSNVIYWYKKGMELYSVDSEFKRKYDLFSDEVDKYLKK